MRRISMRRFSLFGLALAASLLGWDAGEAKAATVVHSASYGGSTYHLVGGAVGSNGIAGITWAAAEAAAISQFGGHLVTVESAEENNFIAATFTDVPRIWIGLNDIGQEAASVGANFTWISGSSSNYRNFWVGEPNSGGNGSEDVVEFFTNHSTTSSQMPTLVGRWNDVEDRTSSDGFQIFALVEVAYIPEPATLSLAAVAAGALVSRRARSRVV